ncbi:MAG: ImmA/IrrE family metallo-endopeptidase [Clostridiales bacterium]|nr:ImmA/IrrE family metallo-endopeptidase [Clostridiales bacterium]
MATTQQFFLYIPRRYPGVEKEEERMMKAILSHWKTLALAQQKQMTPLEKLEKTAWELGIVVSYLPIANPKEGRAFYYRSSSGKYPPVILIDAFASQEEKTEFLAEELAHHHLTVGDITMQNTPNHHKQETLSRLASCKALLPPEKILRAFQKGCTTLEELAEYTGHSYEFLSQTLLLYHQKNLLPPLPSGGCYDR